MSGNRVGTRFGEAAQAGPNAGVAPSRGTLLARSRRVSLCETLDRALNKGAVIAGDVVISVADVDLLYLGVNLVVASIETMRRWDTAPGAGHGAPTLEAGRIGGKECET